MTCFWDGILSSISIDDINKHLISDCTCLSIHQKEFISLLKLKVPIIKQYNVSIEEDGDKIGERSVYTITPKMQAEHAEWIINYNNDGIYGGHDCSICDPFLTIITHIFYLQINHSYMGHLIVYKNTRQILKVLDFVSDTGHFRVK